MELTTSEAEHLATCEEVIERAARAFIEAGEALSEICDERLYRLTHDTFEDYLRERWGMERAHAYRLIASSEVAAVVSPIGDIRSEAVARELSPLRDQSAELMATWSQAIEEHGPAPTAAQVRAVRERRQAPKLVERTVPYLLDARERKQVQKAIKDIWQGYYHSTEMLEAAQLAAVADRTQLSELADALRRRRQQLSQAIRVLEAAAAIAGNTDPAPENAA